jgi:crotonobetainyl-CoA:carnitine CoA-transferase CaiB-like acyl-CoA transferase
MGSPEWSSWEIFQDRQSRSENADVLTMCLEEWLQQHTTTEVFELAADARLPFTPVSTLGDLLRFEHLHTRGFFVTIDHPAAGPVLYPGAPYKLQTSPWQLRRPAPLLGQHNSQIFGRVGLDTDKLARLRNLGVV